MDRSPAALVEMPSEQVDQGRAVNDACSFEGHDQVLGFISHNIVVGQLRDDFGQSIITETPCV
jgi:hypothetical protein